MCKTLRSLNLRVGQITCCLSRRPPCRFLETRPAGRTIFSRLVIQLNIVCDIESNIERNRYRLWFICFRGCDSSLHMLTFYSTHATQEINSSLQRELACLDNSSHSSSNNKPPSVSQRQQQLPTFLVNHRWPQAGKHRIFSASRSSQLPLVVTSSVSNPLQPGHLIYSVKHSSNQHLRAQVCLVRHSNNLPLLERIYSVKHSNNHPLLERTCLAKHSSNQLLLEQIYSVKHNNNQRPLDRTCLEHNYQRPLEQTCLVKHSNSSQRLLERIYLVKHNSQQGLACSVKPSSSQPPREQVSLVKHSSSQLPREQVCLDSNSSLQHPSSVVPQRNHLPACLAIHPNSKISLLSKQIFSVIMRLQIHYLASRKVSSISQVFRL